MLVESILRCVRKLLKIVLETSMGFRLSAGRYTASKDEVGHVE